MWSFWGKVGAYGSSTAAGSDSRCGGWMVKSWMEAATLNKSEVDYDLPLSCWLYLGPETMRPNRPIPLHTPGSFHTPPRLCSTHGPKAPGLFFPLPQQSGLAFGSAQIPCLYCSLNPFVSILFILDLKLGFMIMWTNTN